MSRAVAEVTLNDAVSERIVRDFFETPGAIIPAVQVASCYVASRAGRWKRKKRVLMHRAVRYDVYRSKAGNIASIARSRRRDGSPNTLAIATREAQRIARVERRALIAFAGPIDDASAWRVLADWIQENG